MAIIRFHRGSTLVITIVLVSITVVAVTGCLEKTVLVPEVGGLSAAEAEKALHQADLEVDGEIDGRLPSDCFVRSTDPPAGREIKAGTRVTLEMAVTMPDLTGAGEANATAALGALGLEVVVSREYSESVGGGAVAKTTPAAGSECPAGIRVTLTVSKGSAYMTCPACGGRGWVTELTDCKENAFEWCRKEVKVSCENCSGTGKVLREP